VTLTADPADQREQSEPAGLRCAPAYLASKLPIIGSAPSDMTGWILLEHPGPWPKKGLPDDIAADLRSWLDARPERVQLIHPIERADRRAGAAARRRVYVSAGFGLLGVLDLASLDELADHRDAIDSAAADTAGGDPRLPDGFATVPVDDYPMLVCTQGRRDICCAQWGRPAAVALVEEFGAGRVWETNHLGGHRFAANLVIPPSPLYHGQITPDGIVEVAHGLLADRLPLSTLRGRAGVPAAAQAAEYFVRRDAGLTGVGDVVGVGPDDVTGSWRVQLADGRAFAVDVSAAVGPELPSSCGAEPEAQTRFDLVGLRPI
jgi:hypothetical protein